MKYQPDVIVKDLNSSQINLVVEVKLGDRILPEWVKSLKEYARAMRAPLALLVTPKRALLFSNENRIGAEDSFSEKTVDLHEVFARKKFGPTGNSSRDHDQLAHIVQDWLSGLAAGIGTYLLAPDIPWTLFASRLCV